MARVGLGEIVGRADEIASTIASRHAAAVDAKAVWPEHSIRALQAAGLGGMLVSEHHGGHGHGLLALAQVCEALGKHCASSALCFGMHCAGTAVIQAQASKSQIDNFLVPICEGQHLTTLALSEPGTGAEFYFPQTELSHAPGEDDQFLIDGIKSFVTNGGQADSYVISTVSTDQNRPLGEFSCLVVDAQTEGLEWGSEWTGLGMRGNSSRVLNLKRARIPKQNLLGGEGDQIWYVFNVIAPYFLMAMSGSYLGVASAALEEAQRYLMQRRHRHSGAAVGQLHLPQHRLGTLWATVERTRRLIYHAGAQADAKDPNALPALLSVKSEVAECVTFATNEAMNLCGGSSYQQNGLLARLLRDARAAHVMSPLTDMLRLWTGRALLDQPLLD